MTESTNEYVVVFGGARQPDGKFHYSNTIHRAKVNQFDPAEAIEYDNAYDLVAKQICTCLITRS